MFFYLFFLFFIIIFASGANIPDPNEEIGDDAVLKELFLPFRVFCTRKDVSVFPDLSILWNKYGRSSNTNNHFRVLLNFSFVRFNAMMLFWTTQMWQKLLSSL